MKLLLRLASASAVLFTTALVGSMWLLAAITHSVLIAPFAVLMTAGYFQVLSMTNEAERLVAARTTVGSGGLVRRHIEKGKRWSIQDPETGLMDRWYFDLRLSEEVIRCTRYGLSMAVLTLKTRGSDKADEEWGAGLEGRMAQTMARNLRSVDFATRLNEFEFAACIIQTDEDGAERAAGRIVKAMAAWTPDVGIAIYPQDGEDWQSLLSLALHYQGIKEHADAVVIPFPPDRKTDAA